MSNVITGVGTLAALRAARHFIVNGVELGYIRMPDADTPDHAHDTLPMIEWAIAELEANTDEAKGEGFRVEQAERAPDCALDSQYSARQAWGNLMKELGCTTQDQARQKIRALQAAPAVMQPMDTAPRDGTHILIKYVVTQYTDGNGRHRFKDYRPVGHKWAEFWFVDGKFEPWSGCNETRSINGGGEPIGWAPLPQETGAL